MVPEVDPCKCFISNIEPAFCHIREVGRVLRVCFIVVLVCNQIFFKHISQEISRCRKFAITNSKRINIKHWFPVSHPSGTIYEVIFDFAQRGSQKLVPEKDCRGSGGARTCITDVQGNPRT